ncbi:MAG: DUF1064 domain-containing protein [Muribaculaceae bacterium]|nr:DUF1064 domain-containing protein [Muribaculaceae bacterium]
MANQTPTITPSEYRALIGAKSTKRNKYHAKKTGGHASKKEHGRAGQLQIMLAAGLISNLREQVRFVLIPSQKDNEGNTVEKPCSYIADFVYTDNATGQTIVEDTKGYRTKEYIIKRKLMLSVHGIRIKEI